MAKIIGALVVGVAVAASGVAGQETPKVAEITVIGEVQAPGRPIPAWQLTLSGAIAAAGGFTPYAVVVEVRHRTSGSGPVVAATPAADYRAEYVLRADIASGSVKDSRLAAGDLVIVRRALEMHPPIPNGQFGAGALRLDFAPWGVTTPVVLTSNEPQYTRAGMMAKLQGTVLLEVVVNADGTVDDARVVNSLDARRPEIVAELRRMNNTHAHAVLEVIGDGPLGLDANAIDCVKTWTFTPGTVLGKPTRVVQNVLVSFKLR